MSKGRCGSNFAGGYGPLGPLAAPRRQWLWLCPVTVSLPGPVEPRRVAIVGGGFSRGGGGLHPPKPRYSPSPASGLSSSFEGARNSRKWGQAVPLFLEVQPARDTAGPGLLPNFRTGGAEPLASGVSARPYAVRTITVLASPVSVCLSVCLQSIRISLLVSLLVHDHHPSVGPNRDSQLDDDPITRPSCTVGAYCAVLLPGKDSSSNGWKENAASDFRAPGVNSVVLNYLQAISEGLVCHFRSTLCFASLCSLLWQTDLRRRRRPDLKTRTVVFGVLARRIVEFLANARLWSGERTVFMFGGSVAAGRRIARIISSLVRWFVRLCLQRSAMRQQIVATFAHVV
ncbi:unnamed protein product [Calypogeia fissa]